MTLPNSTINRKSFRHRKVDNKKPLRIYTPGEINEEDCIPVSRTGIEIETGVEKEEEEEWHLVNALKLRTEYMEKGSTASGKATIPVPTSSRRISYYADAYQTHKWKKPSTYVKFSLPVEECIGCLYCMDEKDDLWLVEHKEKTHSTLTEDQFEEIMQHFENVAKNKIQLLAKKLLPSWLDCEACLPESLQDLKGEAEMIHTYWKTKRKERMSRFRKVGPLMFEIKTQEGKDEEDHPWTCFRRRELKPIRRTRRTETASFDKLRKIRKDIHSGRHIMVNVKIREKTKKQKIELDRKIFEKECTVRELRKKLGIRNETSHEPPKRNRKSSSTMDLMGATKTKSGIKLSKKDDEYPMADITEYPYLIQRKPAAASFFRKFDSLKPTDRTSISCTAFRSRFGRGGRRRRIIDRLDVFSYKRIRETNDRFKYDSDGAEDVFSEDEMNLDDEEDNNKVEDLTENMIRFHLFKEEDYQNLGTYRRIQKEKQNSPTKQQSLDALTVNNNPTQSSQQANAEYKQILEQRTILDPRYASSISRTADSRVNVNNQDSRQKPDSDPRTFNGVKCNQGVNAESSTSRLNSNPPTPRLSNDPRATRDSRLVNNSIANSRAHNGLIIRPTVATMNHRDNVTPYMRPMPRMISDDSTKTNNVVANNRGLINSSLVKNHATAQLTPVAQINSPASSNNNNINGQGNGDGLRHTSSNQGNVNGTTSMIDPSKGLTATSGQAIDPSKISMSIDQTKILFNESNQIVNVTTGESAKLVNSVEAQKINNLIKPTQRMGIGNGLNGVQQTINTSIHSTSAAAQQFMFTSQDFSQLNPSNQNSQTAMTMRHITNLRRSELAQNIQNIQHMTSNSSTSNVTQQTNNIQNNQLRQSMAQAPRQQNNITLPNVGLNVPSNSVHPSKMVLSSGMGPSPSTPGIRQNNGIQSSSSTKHIIAHGLFTPNNMSQTPGSSNVRQNVLNLQKLLMNQNISGVNGSHNINVNTNSSLGNNGSQTINVNPNVSLGTNGQFVQGNLMGMNGIIPANGQPTSIMQLNGQSYIIANNMSQLNGASNLGLRPGNGSANLGSRPNNMVLPINLRQGTPTLRQVPTNGAAAALRHNMVHPNGFITNGANFRQINSTQMRPQQPMMRHNMILNPQMLPSQILTNGQNNNLEILLTNSPIQNNVSPASVSTSNGGNNSVGTPSPQPQAEQRTVR